LQSLLESGGSSRVNTAAHAAHHSFNRMDELTTGQRDQVRTQLAHHQRAPGNIELRFFFRFLRIDVEKAFTPSRSDGEKRQRGGLV
jgi:hypothetical protein